jgi:GntR family transcriptional repressor for pyruvate dehydrogenase complex
VGSLTTLWTAQEEAWAETLAPRGEYPSDTGAVVATHSRLADEIAAGRADEAARVARAHLAATQALFLDRFDGLVDATSARGRSLSPSLGWRV